MPVMEALQLYQGDISEEFEESALVAETIGCDIETSGLDWRTDRIGTCQVHRPGAGTAVVQVNGGMPKRLMNVLESGNVRKVFHHAPFDLRFMVHQWNLRPTNIACTKVASKLLHPSRSNDLHSLQPLLKDQLGVVIDKALQRSDWLVESLSESQLNYAAGDVHHLVPLYEALMVKMAERGLVELAEGCFDHIPHRVLLELGGYGDVFVY